MRVNVKLLSNGRITWVVCKCTGLKPILLLYGRTINSEVRFITSNSCCPVEGSVQYWVSHTIQLLSILFPRTYFRYIINTCEVLLCTGICSSNSASHFTRRLYIYTEGCLVVYSVSEFDFVRRVAAYVCLCVINTCDSVTGIKSETDPHEYYCY
jgi:hypothetical protein